MYKYVIDQPIYGHNRYVVPEAESFEHACEQIVNGMMDDFLVEEHVFDDTGDYECVSYTPLAKKISKNEFTASRWFNPAYELGGTEHPVPALVYMFNLFIELSGGDYVLTIANEIYTKKLTSPQGLAQLEDLLYAYAIDEGMITGTA